MFDSWAVELAPVHYREFSLPYIQQISSTVRSTLREQSIPEVPMILFAKGANWGLEEFSTSAGYDVLGLDWVMQPELARKQVQGRVSLQGNLDPNVLYGGREAIEREVIRMAKAFKSDSGVSRWICNLGHGITPGVDPEDLKWFFECVHKYCVA